MGSGHDDRVLKLSWPETRGYWEVPVLYEDEHVLALDKPAHLLTSPDRFDPNQPSLMALLHLGITRQSPWAARRSISYLSDVHRLDYETTGTLLLARNKAAFTTLADQFSGEKPHRVYYAIVHGHPGDAEFEVDAKLAPCPTRPGAMRVDPLSGKKSKTRFELVETFQSWSLLRCLPLTERTHQIRVHLNTIGLPIAGDILYGGGQLLLSQLKPAFRPKASEPERPLAFPIALHAAELAVTHPVTESRITINAPFPKGFQAALNYLRKFAKSSVWPGREPMGHGTTSPA